MKRLSLIAACLLLAACTPPPVSEEEQMRIDRDRCLSYGAAPGTPAFDLCMGRTTGS